LNFPDAHGEQLLLILFLIKVYPLSHTQSKTVLLPWRDHCCKSGHAAHAASFVAAIATEYFPCPHWTQPEEPSTILYVPGTQAVQFSPRGVSAAYPGMHKHCERLVLEMLGVDERSGHRMHELVPELVEYVPRVHGEHVIFPRVVLSKPGVQGMHLDSADNI
jgi:hypothetical protein